MAQAYTDGQNTYVVQPVYYVDPQQLVYTQQVAQAVPPPPSHQQHRVVVPPGTYLPGTPLTVGSHHVKVVRYLSQGGFAHVYVVKLDRPESGTDVAVLKRVAVPDKETLRTLRTEVDTMKRLRNRRNVVNYIDSHASHLKEGGYEVFVLMEYCSGGGLIDFMNTRLQNRLTESEILNIFGDVVEGVSCMHYLDPPLIHRDIKVENVLISDNGVYKICDFGSSSIAIGPGMTGQECRMIEDDIMKHTTMPYRSPEMVDVYRRIPIDEKSDIWALGVLLYKLCYYTTPFEEQGQLAILNAAFKFPSHPPYSDRLKRLISAMLKENPRERLNIYLVLKEVCSMRGVEVPIPDKYTMHVVKRSSMPPPSRNQTTTKTRQNMPSFIKYESQQPQQKTIPDIKPMRRGRVPPPSHIAVAPAAPVDQPIDTLKIDIDSPSETMQFASYLPTETPSPPPDESELSDADAVVSSRFPSLENLSQPQRPAYSTESSRKASKSTLSDSSMSIKQPQPKRPVLVANSTSISPDLSKNDSFERAPLPRTSQPMSRTASDGAATHSSSRSEFALPMRAPSRGVTPSTSRHPSQELNTTGRGTPGVQRRMSSKSRPASMFFDSSMEFLRNLSNRSATASPASSAHSGYDPGYLNATITGQSQASEHIESNIEFLKSLDTGASNLDNRWQQHGEDMERRNFSNGSTGSSKHGKRSSISAMSFMGASKNRLSGKFGEAFRKFEQNAGPAKLSTSPERKEMEAGKRMHHVRQLSAAKLFHKSATPSAELDTASVKSAVIPNATGGSKETAPAKMMNSTGSWEVTAEEIPVFNEAVQRFNSIDSKHEMPPPELPRRSTAPLRKTSPAPMLPPPPRRVKTPASAASISPVRSSSSTISAPPSRSSVRSSTTMPPPTSPVTKPEIATSEVVESPRASAIRAAERRPRAQSIQNRVQILLSQSQAAPVTRTANGYGHYSDAAAEAAAAAATAEMENDGGLKSMLGDTDAASSSSLTRHKPLIPRQHQNTSSRSMEHAASGHVRHGTASSSDSSNFERPAPPPKPIKLKASTASVPSSPQRGALPAAEDGGGIEDWEMDRFKRRFPAVAGRDELDSSIRRLAVEDEEQYTSPRRRQPRT
ncbi:uncharacterized protein V1518DRAFT_454935 [Limtongia smithiae]|uniref:uncharacterized protein n=1 Tax=Limtongia smithiae TaxID=1125753 RepID=UPI0034CF5F74